MTAHYVVAKLSGELANYRVQCPSCDVNANLTGKQGIHGYTDTTKLTYPAVRDLTESRVSKVIT